MKKRTTRKTTPRGTKAVSAEVQRMPSCYTAIRTHGVSTASGVSRVLAALIEDISGNTIDARGANAMNNSIGKLIKNFEMAHKYGQPSQTTKKLAGVKYVE